jgi:hypothetical protein
MGLKSRRIFRLLRILVKQVVFTAHAEVKLQILGKHGFKVLKEDIVNAVKNPEGVVSGGRRSLLHRRFTTRNN